MKVGFTGTRKGMTDEQEFELIKLLVELRPIEFHHGDCIGADEEAHHMARDFDNCQIIIHPPIDNTYRAFCENDVILPPKPYKERNHDIVNASDLLIASPKSFNEERRSGTWSTIRYAKKQGKKVIILEPK
jgi:hypothetical protein